MPAAHSVDLGGFHAGRGNGLWTCVIQLPARSQADIEADATNPEGIAILEQLVREGPNEVSRLAQDAQANQTCLILFPEYAFGSGDWALLDQLVNGFSRDLIVIAAFGASPVACIAAIEGAATISGTAIYKGWDVEPTGDRPLNFGGVWIKNEARIACVLFGKRYAEQSVEATKLAIREFPASTAIALDDLWIMPTICADLVKRAGQDGTASVVSQITDHLRQDEKPALITGSLLQPTGQSTNAWTGSIDGLAYSLGNKNAAILICNVSTNAPDNKDGAELWRNLTGVYLSRHFSSSGYGHQRSFVYHAGQNLIGWSARSWYPQLLFGELRFPPYTTTTHNHAWVSAGRLEASHGLQVYSRSAIEEDLLLYCHVSGLGDPVKQILLATVRSHILGGDAPRSAKLAVEFTNGPFFNGVPSLEPLLDINVIAMRQCLQGANALLMASARYNTVAVNWQSHEARRGQFTIDAKSAAFWVSSELLRDQMLEKLRRDTEAVATNETLIIFGRGKENLGFEQGIWEEMCRDRTQDTGEEEAPFSDLPITSVASRSEYILVRDFGHVHRLIIGEQGTDAAEKKSAFDLLMNICSGTKP